MCLRLTGLVMQKKLKCAVRKWTSNIKQGPSLVWLGGSQCQYVHHRLMKRIATMIVTKLKPVCYRGKLSHVAALIHV